MQTSFSADAGDPDQALREAFDERPGRGLRIRLQPSILRASQGRAGQHIPWKHVRWSVDCESVEEASALREALRLFFVLVAERGPEAMLAALLAGVDETTPVP